MNEFLIKILLVSPEMITRVVVVACLLLFVLPLMRGFRRLQSISPGSMISVGILGTFWGTLLALHGFNTSADIDQGALDYSGMVKSIPQVIEGMKVAFITSLIGLFSAFVAKIAYTYIPVKDGEYGAGLSPVESLLKSIKDAINGNTEDSLFAQLNKLRSDLRNNMNTLKDAITNMNSNVNESLEGLKVETNEHLDAVGESLTEINERAGRSLELGAETNTKLLTVGESLAEINERAGRSLELGAETNTKLLTIDGSLANMNERVGASLDELASQTRESLAKLDQINGHMAGLSDAIRNSLVENLNTLINEIQTTVGTQLLAMTERIEHALINQFGETFQQFNEATHAIRDWQSEHTGQVERLTEAFETSAAGIEQIREDCESIPQSMAELNTIIGELNVRVEAFADMRERALDAFPAIEGRLNNIASDLASAASGFDGLEETIGGLEATIQQAMGGMVERIDELADGYTAAVNGVVQEITREWGDRMVGIAEHVTQQLRGDGQQ